MTESAISALKKHLPEMVHLAETVHITRHIKPIAVMVSLEQIRERTEATVQSQCIG